MVDWLLDLYLRDKLYFWRTVGLLVLSGGFVLAMALVAFHQLVGGR